jgi:hypothetical protein
MKITVIKKASVRTEIDRVCPFVVEGLPEPRK